MRTQTLFAACRLALVFSASLAATPALALEFTDAKTGVTTSIQHTDNGMSLSNNIVGKMVDNQHVYGFVSVDSAHYTHEEFNEMLRENPNALPASANASIASVGVSYRW